MFTVDELIAEVRKLANENPDFVYEEEYCFYTRGGDCENPGCLIGRAIVNLDKSLKSVLEEVDANGSIGVRTILYKLDLTSHSYYAMDWLDYVQSQQDIGWAWSQAIKLADKNYPLY